MHEPSEGSMTLQDSVLGGLGWPWHLPPHNAQGNRVKKSQRPSWVSTMPSGVKAGSALSWGLEWGLLSTSQGFKDQADTLHQLQEPPASRASWPAPLHHDTHGRPCLPRERKAAVSAREDPPPPGRPRGCVRSVPVEFFQHCGVGVFKQPLLGG